MDTAQAQPGAASAPAPEFGTPSSPEAVTALNAFRTSNAEALGRQDAVALAEYRRLSDAAFFPAAESNTAPAKVIAPAQTVPANSGTPADAINAAETYKRENAAALFSRNPDRAKVAELARLNAMAFPDVPDAPGQIIYQPAEDGITHAANGAVNDVPADPGGYKLDHTTMVPGTHDKALEAEYRTLAHADLKLPQATAAYIFAKHNELMAHPETALSEAASTEKLRAIWGGDFDRKMGYVKEALHSIPAAKRERAAQLFSMSGIGNDVGMLSQLAFLGEVRAAAKNER